MKLTKLLLILVIVSVSIIGVSGISLGESWKYYSSAGFFHHYYDKDSVKSSSNIVTVWGKYIIKNEATLQEYIRARASRNMTVKGYEKLSYEKHLLEINCTSREYRILIITSYAKDGSLLYSNSFTSAESPVRRIPTGSAIEQLYKAVCK